MSLCIILHSHRSLGMNTHFHSKILLILGNPTVKIKPYCDCLIFTIEFSLIWRRDIYIESGPRSVQYEMTKTTSAKLHLCLKQYDKPLQISIPWTGRGEVVDLRATRRSMDCPYIYVLPVNLRAHGPNTCATLLFHYPAISVLVKREITRHDPKNLSILIIFIINHNIYWFRAMIISAVLNIKRGDFNCHSHLILILFSS